ncbi:MAG: ABC transporter substrate-binding protein [Deltaproteobacteria bacterium]|nr:ABC transporter substrate-binding protein [Deltaproteobacteria bacterium]
MVKKNVTLMFLMPIILTLVIGGFLNTPQALAKEPIKVGSVIPLTGNFARIAAAQKDGILLAEKQINAKGGVLGRPIKVYLRDSELNATIATRRLQDLVAKEKIDWHVARGNPERGYYIRRKPGIEKGQGALHVLLPDGGEVPQKRCYRTLQLHGGERDLYGGLHSGPVHDHEDGV